MAAPIIAAYNPYTEDRAPVVLAQAAARLTGSEREQLGVTPGMVRVSIGIEDVADLIRDLRAGLDAAAGTASPTAHAAHRHLLQHAAVARS